SLIGYLNNGQIFGTCWDWGNWCCGQCPGVDWLAMCRQQFPMNCAQAGINLCAAQGQGDFACRYGAPGPAPTPGPAACQSLLTQAVAAHNQGQDAQANALRDQYLACVARAAWVRPPRRWSRKFRRSGCSAAGWRRWAGSPTGRGGAW